MCLTIPLLIDYAQFRVVMYNKVNQSRWCIKTPHRTKLVLGWVIMVKDTLVSKAIVLFNKIAKTNFPRSYVGVRWVI